MPHVIAEPAGSARRWPTRPSATALALTAILVLAAAVRVLGSRWGLPMTLHPDEWAVVDGAIDMARRNSFEPPWMLRPDHVEMKLDYLAFAAYAGPFEGMSIEAAFAADPSPFYMIARLVTAAFGVGTVVLAFLIGRRSSDLEGLFAAVLFSLLPVFVRHAHFATPDVPLTFALMLMMYALMRYLAAASWWMLLLASFAVALAITTKYPGALGAIVVGVVVIVSAIRDSAPLRILTHGVGSLVAVLGFVFLISPVLLTDLSGLRAELDIQAQGNRFGMPDLSFTGNLWYYLSNYVRSSGILLAALGVLGVVVVIRRRQIEAIPWLTGIVVWLGLSTMSIHWERWGFPMYVTPLLLAAAALAYLVQRFRETRLRWALVALTALVSAKLVTGAAAVVAGLLAPDTRAAALTWAKANDITTETTVFEGYTPFSPGTPVKIFKRLRTVDGRLEPVTKEGNPAGYVVLSSAMYDRVIGQPGHEHEKGLYQQIFDSYDELQRFDPAEVVHPSAYEPVSIVRSLRFIRDIVGGGMSGPRILVYEVPVASR